MDPQYLRSRHFLLDYSIYCIGFYQKITERYPRTSPEPWFPRRWRGQARQVAGYLPSAFGGVVGLTIIISLRSVYTLSQQMAGREGAKEDGH